MDSEKAKMISEKPYKAFDDELLKERQYAKEQVFDLFDMLKHNNIINYALGGFIDGIQKIRPNRT